MRLVKRLEGMPFSVAIHQVGHLRFRITYGKQVMDGLNYAEAAREFGLCVFHALACEGLLKQPEK